MKYPIAMITIAALFTAACSPIGKAIENNEVAAELAVTIATGRVLDKNPSWAPRTVAITASAGQHITGDAILHELEEYVVGQIDWSALFPDEEIALRVLLAAAKEEIAAYLDGKGYEDPGQAKVEASKVLLWINRVASAYVARGV